MSTTSIFEFREGYKSPFGNWLKDKDEDQFLRHYFKLAEVDSLRNVTMYNNVEENKSRILSWFADNTLEDYKVTVFFHSNGNEVLEQYQTKSIAHNEIAVFFETEEGFNLAGSVYRIRLGSTVVKDLKKWWFQDGEVDADELAKQIIKKFPKAEEIGEDKLIKLIEGELDKEKWTYDFKYMFYSLRVHPLDFLNIFSLLASGLRGIKPDDPKYWNASLPPSVYEPIFPLPALIKVLDLDHDKIAETLGDTIIEKMDAFFENITSTKEEDLGATKENDKAFTKESVLKNIDYVIPDSIEELIKSYFEALKELYYDSIRPNIKDFIKTVLIASEEFVYLVTAFLTGAISGTLELIAGVLDLIGVIFKYSLDEDFRDGFKEQIENFVEALFTNTKETLNEIWEALKELFKKITDYVITETSYELAYKLGEAIFEIVEFIYGALKLAKAKKISQALDALKKGSDKKAIKEKVDGKLDKVGKEIDDNLKSTKEVFKLPSFEEFSKSIYGGFPNDQLAKKSYSLFKNEKWKELEFLFTDNKLNGGWPPNGGFVSSKKTTLKKGTIFDRYGGKMNDEGFFEDSGKYVSPVEVKSTERALKPGTTDLPKRKYIVLKEINNVKEGKAIPWFDEKGLGIQYQLKFGIDYLLEKEYIKLID